jgi:O-antigen/teichoic acid export membrane protein
VAALEFAQAGAVVRAQKILADRGLSASATPRTRVVVVAALPVAMLSVVALWALGVLRPQYHVAWLYGLCLLPGCLAVSVGQVWSAFLLRLRGEAATLMVAVLTLAVAVPAYYLLIPRSGALGAAVASTCAYAVYALASRLSLRRLPEPVAYQVV